MANKKITFEVDIDGKPIDVVIDKTLNLKQAARELTKELNKTKEGTKEFQLLSTELGNVQDKMASTNAKSRDLFASFSLIPGPIGDIASQLNGAIGLMKTFSSFSIADLKFQFKETFDDITDIASALGKATGITRIYTIINNALTKSMIALGVAETTAAAGARALAGALVATGIGAFVVALGLAVNALVEFFDSEKKAKEEADKFTASLDSQNRVLDANAKDLKRRQTLRIAEMKAAGATEKQIRDEELKNAKKARDEAYNDDIEAAKNYNKSLEITDKAAFEKAKVLKTQKEQALKDAENNIKVITANNRIADAKEVEAAAQKAFEKQQKLAAAILAQKKDAITQYKEALDVQIQNEVDAENTTEARLAPLIEKRKKAENVDLDNALITLKEQLKLGIVSKEQAQVIEAGITAKRIAIDTKYRDLVTKALEEDSKRIEEENKKKEEEIKDAETFARKLVEIRISAIKDATEKEKTERTNKYLNELSDLEKDKNFIKLSEEEKTETRKNLRIALNNDLKAIDEKAALEAKAAEQKVFDEQLRLLELQGQSLLAGTQAYFDNRQAILDKSMEKELAGLVKGSEEYLAIQKKYATLGEKLDQDKLAADGRVISATLDSFATLGTALASSYDEEAKTSEEAFNKRKKLQKATAIMSAASGIVQILTQPSTLPSPADFIVKGINAAALAIATGINISKIDATTFSAPDSASTGSGGEAQTSRAINVVATRAQGGIIRGAGTSTSDSIPAFLSNGEYVVNAKATQSFLPLLNSINDAGLQPKFDMGGLSNNNNYGLGGDITQSIGNSMSMKPQRAYVVSNDITNQQQFDRTIKSRSLM
jgi:hypothetical protein